MFKTTIWCDRCGKEMTGYGNYLEGITTHGKKEIIASIEFATKDCDCANICNHCALDMIEERLKGFLNIPTAQEAHND